MYQNISLLADAEDTVSAHMSGDIPVITLGGHGYTTIHVPHAYPSQSIAWLRHLAEQASSLAEVIEAANVASLGLAVQCDCDALELPNPYAVLADPDESGVTHSRTWCGNREPVAR